MSILSTLSNFEEPLIEAIQAVQKAADHIVLTANNNSPLKVTVKPDATLVLNLDLELQKILLDNLKKLPIVSEEMPQTHSKIGTSSDYYVVDPLDGTTSAKRFLTAINSQVGFGPMVGVVNGGKVVGVVFFNTPQRKFFIAQLGKGCFVFDYGDNSGASMCRVNANCSLPLVSCAVLFYAGKNGELNVVNKLKNSDAVENFYRFGGFANDCSRLAQGFEQIQIQFSVKAWDLPAALLSAESGLDVRIDPFGIKVPIKDWVIQNENPLITAPCFDMVMPFL
jgi:fructose-1,6-bisphosphatase/inositol monophosphatase family enzyme